ncbi:hypothetical protein [Vibrio parahaemolyticus]|uniref:hypothetical protein n=1 Tax=Vibrio harveyi group TaxID=717610 RepID=UPI00084A5D33|nr:hypothetical protein [Vibrio parahaemolyticus]HBC3807974.1 hypothetical protein [Vibrio alginolyticus]EGR3456559.1 hypothetical protein [Vibrio parahaemolyticus]EID7759964.1 hypothetical protein [Vibrio parahaemolyticus]EIT7125985.1 hypothetical protein [Vibrio parahaemolyticus]EIT7130868.1 hypothetical protein [Vibrio parahaemolyticus]
MTKKKVLIDHLNLNEVQKREFLKLVLGKVESGRLKPIKVNRLKPKYENQLLEFKEIIDIYKSRGFSNKHLTKLFNNGFGISKRGAGICVNIPEYQLELFIQKHLPQHTRKYKNKIDEGKNKS